MSVYVRMHGRNSLLKQYMKTILPLVVYLLFFSHCLSENPLDTARTKADEGNAAAMVELGNMNKEGRATEQNYTEAVKWYGMVADQKDADALFSLGLMYFLGQGVAQNDAKAATFFKKAADFGNVDALVNIGSMYRDGRGVEKDYAKAIAYWTVALQLNSDETANKNLLVALADATNEEYAEGRRQAVVIFNNIPK